MSFRAQRGQFIPVSHLRHQRRFFCRQKSTLSASSVMLECVEIRKQELSVNEEIKEMKYSLSV